VARKRDRAFAGFFAGLFLLTSSALTIGVIYQLVQQHNANQPKPPCSTVAANNKENIVDNKKKLQGSQLANFEAGCTISKLETIDTKVGAGAAVQASQTVTVDYTGAVAATGVIFQSSKDTGQPVTFPLNQVIPGWTQGIPGLKVGGTRRLLIPANLAYGANAPQGSGIPANADLVFDVTLHSIGK
jgi:FKBP-type peptidyl-prolyl cis-trans isomerase